jgi:putrescine---pyruvate transaminase
VSKSAFLHPFAKPSREDFVTIVSGDGAVIRDADGNEYIDALASLWYCQVGHGRTEIADAVAAQMRKLEAFHTFELFTNEPVEQACTKIAELAPFDDARVFLTCSGSEAVDSAIKIARRAHAAAGEPERTVIISRQPSYHGVTYGALAATGLPPNQEGFGPMLGDVVQVPYDDASAVADLFSSQGDRIAAVLAEPVVGAGGVYPPPDGYLDELRRLCDEHGAFLILDEVICGFGRLGAWWGAQHFGVRPDLVTFAKGVTSGYQPLGGVLVSPKVREPLEADPDLVLRHGHTYSGHPAACAAAVANLVIMEREDLVARSVVVGETLKSRLEKVVDGERVVGLRGAGAMWAIALAEGIDAGAVRDDLLARGVIPRPIGASTLAFCPPLVISDAQIDRCGEALGEALDAVAAGVS